MALPILSPFDVHAGSLHVLVNVNSGALSVCVCVCTGFGLNTCFQVFGLRTQEWNC